MENSDSQPMPIVRSCSFCDFSALYEEFPDDSVIYCGIAACADCLKTEATKEFREMLAII